MLILFLVLYGSVSPIIYILIHQQLEEVYFSIRLISPESFMMGHLYTFVATILLLHAAYVFRPMTSGASDAEPYKSTFRRYRSLIYFTAIVSLSIGIGLS